MKHVKILFMVLIVIGLAACSKEESFGPENWNQYRLDPTKNAVFESDKDALDSTTFETEDEIRSTPVIAGDQLFAGNHNTGDLSAFDITTGEKEWESEAPNWVHSEMIHHDGQVFVGFGNRYFQDSGIRGTEESGVLALDAETGDIDWKYNTDGEVMPTPVYYEDHVYAATGDSHIYKLDSETGDEVEKTDIGHVVSMSSPTINDDMLYVGGGRPEPYAFTGYDLDEDEIKWQTEFPDAFAGLDDVPPAVDDGKVVTTALTGDSDDPEHWMYAMDAETGEKLWETSLGTGDFVKNNKSGAPMIYEGNIYVGSPITETFYAYDLESGDKLWEFKDEVMKAPPVAKDGIVYFTNTKGMVHALDADSGEEVGKKELNGTLAPSGPVIVNDTLIVGSQDSNVYVVPLSDIVDEE